MKKIICFFKGHIWVEAVKTHTPLLYVFRCGRCNLWKEFILTGQTFRNVKEKFNL